MWLWKKPGLLLVQEEKKKKKKNNPKALMIAQLAYYE